MADVQRAQWHDVVQTLTGLERTEVEELAAHLDAIATEISDVYFAALADFARAQADKTDEPAATPPKMWN